MRHSQGHLFTRLSDWEILPQHQDTPHNVGQTVLDFLARSLRAEWVREEHAMLARIELPAKIVYLIKPLTYVNVTGPCCPSWRDGSTSHRTSASWSTMTWTCHLVRYAYE